MLVTRRVACVYTAAFLLAFSGIAPAAARAGSKDAPTAAGVVDISKVRIDNFGRVSGIYYRGAQPSDRDYQDLAALGINTLVNLTSDDAQPNEKAMAAQAGMRYFQIPMTTHDAPTSAELAEFLKIVNDPANQPVYVHCVGGRHRTGVMTAAYRMTQHGWTADQAFKEMKHYKFGADFLHPEFKEFVYGYHADVAPTAPAHAGVAVKN